jgi:LSD1 subclass zinc finger protein
MNEIRCGHCRRLLARGHAVAISIKCPRCKTLNTISTEKVPSIYQRAAHDLAA